jgi:hypothetical protein
MLRFDFPYNFIPTTTAAATAITRTATITPAMIRPTCMLLEVSEADDVKAMEKCLIVPIQIMYS